MWRTGFEPRSPTTEVANFIEDQGGVTGDITLVLSTITDIQQNKLLNSAHHLFQKNTVRFAAGDSSDAPRSRFPGEIVRPSNSLHKSLGV